MDKDNIILSTSYLELINNIDNVIFDLLYNEQTGFTKLTSKYAVENSNKVIEKFNFEVQKIVQNSKFDGIYEIIEEKKSELVKFLEEYTDKEVISWCEETFNRLVDNSLLSIFIFKNNPDKLKDIYSRIFYAINWIAEIKKLTKEDKNKLLKDFEIKSNQIIFSDNYDYMPELNSENTDEKEFLKLRNDFIEKPINEIDVSKSKNKLSKEDMVYITRLQNDFKSYKKFQARDEIILVNSAIEIMKLKNDREKYNFIKEVDGDITIFLLTNKKIGDEDKTEIIKKRMKLFYDSQKNNKTSEYYKKLLV